MCSVFEELIIAQCAPTLAGIKCASLFSYHFQEKEDALADIREANTRLNMKGIYVLPVKWESRRALLLVFRRSSLACELFRSSTRDVLTRFGYEAAPESSGRPRAAERNMASCLACLIRRLAESEAFPHEIGLFLGYPEEDVLGFIEHRGENCKCCGTWKVYGDVARSEALFRKYRHCTEVYRKVHAGGKPLEAMTVCA